MEWRTEMEDLRGEERRGGFGMTRLLLKVDVVEGVGWYTTLR